MDKINLPEMCFLKGQSKVFWNQWKASSVLKIFRSHKESNTDSLTIRIKFEDI